MFSECAATNQHWGPKRSAILADGSVLLCKSGCHVHYSVRFKFVHGFCACDAKYLGVEICKIFLFFEYLVEKIGKENIIH
jgi:hypothetical protein